MQLQLIQENARIHVFDGATNVEIMPDQCVLKVQAMPQQSRSILQNFGLLGQLSDGQQAASMLEESMFYFTNPAEDRFSKLLHQLQHHEFHLRELPDKIRASEIL